MILVLAYTIFIRKNLLEFVVDYDSLHQTPSDFTLFLTNLPKKQMTEEKISGFLNKGLAGDKEFKIIDVNMTYDLEEISE